MTAPQSRWLRLLANIAWTALGVVMYWTCSNIFGGYPQAHSELLSWLAVGLIMLTGAIVWLVYPRRDDEP